MKVTTLLLVAAGALVTAVTATTGAIKVDVTAAKVKNGVAAAMHDPDFLIYPAKRNTVVAPDEIVKRDAAVTNTVTVYPSYCGAAPTTSAPAATPVCQIGDGQLQAGSGAECATSAPPAPPAPPVTSNTQAVCQIGDGQLQAGSGAECATSSATPVPPVTSNTQAVCQIGDGQLQAGSGAECATSTLTSTLSGMPPSVTVPPANTPSASATSSVGTVITSSSVSYAPPRNSWSTMTSTGPSTTIWSTLSYTVPTSSTKPTAPATSTPPAQETGGAGKLEDALGGLAALALFMHAAL